MAAKIGNEMSAVIDVLEIGKCSDPFINFSESSSSISYMLFMVSEKSSAMQVTDDQLASLKSMAMSDWLESQIATTEVTIHGLHGSTHLDSETLSWIDYQVQKLVKKRTDTTP